MSATISDPGLVDELPEGVLVLDAERRITAASAVMARMTGWPEADLLGRPCGEVLDCSDAPAATPGPDRWPAVARLRGARAIAPRSAVLKASAGRRLAVTVAGTYRRDERGCLVGAVLTVQARARGGRTPPTGVEMVSTVSHELRSPLTSVKGYTSLMLNRWDQLSDDQKKTMLEQVNHDADRVTRLITELLDISRLETGRLVLRRRLVDLPRLAASVVDKVALEYPDLEATTGFAPGFPAVYFDPDKIEQVLTNLVENACKYASPKGLRIEGTTDAASVTVAVADRGPGIPGPDMDQLFTQFFRRTTGRPSGSGLGLWISRGLIEAHGGELRAESKEGHGTTFRFTLPIIDLDELQTR